MCACDPRVRTPFCGKPGCHWPKPEPKDSNEVVPGHALYAPFTGTRIIADLLRERTTCADPDRFAVLIVARLADHDPPILLATPDEFKAD